MPTKAELEKENAELKADLISLGDEVRSLTEDNTRLDSALEEALAEVKGLEDDLDALQDAESKVFELEEIIEKAKYYNRPITLSALEYILY